MDIPWLNRSSFPWLDTGPSPGVQEAFRTGLQIAQNNKDRELRAKELELRVKQLDSVNLLREEELNAKQITQEGLVAVTKVVSEIARDGKWTDPASKSRFWGEAAKYPQMQMHPSFRELTQQFELAEQAEQRRMLEDTRIAGRSDLETQRQQGREKLLHEKFMELSEMQQDSVAARAKRDEIQHLYRMEEQAARPPTGASRFDLPWTDQRAMDAEMESVTRDLFANPEEKAKRIETIYRKYKGIAEQYRQTRTKQAPGATAPPPGKILKFNPETGKFE